MKIYISILLLLILVSSCTNSTDTTEPKVPDVNKTKEMTKQLRHVVLFKFNEASTPDEIQKVEAAFAALPSKISAIKDFEWGLNNSPEGLDKGFTHCFFLTFDSEEGRSAYLPHPAHQAFVDLLSPHVEDALVLDYWTK